ncbi:MAG TPA: PxKF domain-containing protein, partial [Pyrinomonadaceae bacterium]|nr:PxKF domain-containing protein [Pyrinomonadaceae bacterium]
PVPSANYTNNVNAGNTASASFTFPGDTNHNGSSDSETFSIDKADSTTTITCTAGSVYTGSAIEPCTYTVTGNEAANPVLVAATPVPSPNYTNNVNAGVNTASASFTFPGDTNHNGSSDSETFSIDKRTLTASIINDPTKVYDGNANAILAPGNFSIANLVAGQNFTVTKTTGTYNSADVAVANLVSTTLAASDFTPTGGANANNYNLPTSASGPGHITAKPLTITADNKSFLFGDPLPPLTVSYNAFIAGEGVGNLGGSLTFTIKNASNVVVPYNGSTPSGTYTIIPSGLTSTNYAITFVNGTLTIGAWTITGFYQPVDMNTPSLFIWNTIKGGSTVPLKFNIYAGPVGPLTERKNVSDVMFGSIQVADIPCNSSAGIDSFVDYVTNTGNTTLRYDGTGAQFIQNWQTPKGPNKCYQVRMTALDGSHIDAFFKTK